jgi:hypothetical protein
VEFFRFAVESTSTARWTSANESEHSIYIFRFLDRAAYHAGAGACGANVCGEQRIASPLFSQKPVFSPDGKFAYMRGTDELTLPGPNGKAMTLHLRGVSLWRFDPDGQRRCVIDVSNEEPPPGT